MGQAQNLAKGRDGPGQPVKSWDGTWAETIGQILTACSVPWDKTGQSRKGHSKAGKGHSKTEKDVLKFFCYN